MQRRNAPLLYDHFSFFLCFFIFLPPIIFPTAFGTFQNFNPSIIPFYLYHGFLSYHKFFNFAIPFIKKIKEKQKNQLINTRPNRKKPKPTEVFERGIAILRFRRDSLVHTQVLSPAPNKEFQIIFCKGFLSRIQPLSHRCHLLFALFYDNIAAEVTSMELKEKLKELRSNANLTQEDLANQLFVSRTLVSEWESGVSHN